MRQKETATSREAAALQTAKGQGCLGSCDDKMDIAALNIKTHCRSRLYCPHLQSFTAGTTTVSTAYAPPSRLEQCPLRNLISVPRKLFRSSTVTPKFRSSSMMSAIAAFTCRRLWKDRTPNCSSLSSFKRFASLSMRGSLVPMSAEPDKGSFQTAYLSTNKPPPLSRIFTKTASW